MPVSFMRNLILFLKTKFLRSTYIIARIEPIVLPGSVFFFETVAALISFGYENMISNTQEFGIGERLWFLRLHAAA